MAELIAGPPLFNIPRNDSHIGHNFGKLGAEAPLSYREVDGYREQFEETDAQATRVFDVPWSQRLTFKNFVLGWNVVIPGETVEAEGGGITSVTPARISRTIPWQHPEIPWLYAMRCELQNGIGAIGEVPPPVAVDENNQPVLVANPGNPFAPPGVVPLRMIRYLDYSTALDGLARYAVTYGVLPYEVLDDGELTARYSGVEMARYVQREFTFAASNLPLPAASVTFRAGANNGDAIPQSGNIILLGTVNCAYTWHQVPDVAVTAITTAVGKVNETAFDGLQGFPLFGAETLLCMAPKTTRHRGPTGRIHWTVVYNFIYRAQGWNNYPDSKGIFQPVANDSGDPVYDFTEFADLFKPPQPVTYQ